jgi:hypothetical protein
VLLLGFCGRARGGKSTAAEAVRAHAEQQGMRAGVYDIGAEILSYCKLEGKIGWDKTREELNKDELSTLVEVGHNKRLEDMDFWLKSITRKVYQDRYEVALIPNIRMQNECDFIRKNSGYVVKVSAFNPDGSQHISNDRDPNHPLETSLLNVPADYYIAAQKGDAGIVGEQAITIFQYVLGLREEGDNCGIAYSASAD